MLQEYTRAIRSNDKMACEVVWLETTGSTTIVRGNSAFSRNDAVRIVSCASDPVGWDDEDDKNDDTKAKQPSLSDLNSLTRAIASNTTTKRNNDTKDDNPDSSRRTTTVLIIESLTPLLVRHGSARVLHWLSELQSCCNGPVVVPVLVESMTDKEHRALEDMANGVLYAHRGDLTWIRQGVRERGNLLRETIPFRIRSDGVVEILTDEEAGEGIDDHDHHDGDGLGKGGMDKQASGSLSSRLAKTSISSGNNPTEQQRKGKAKITLKMEEGDQPRAVPSSSMRASGSESNTTMKTPRIYVEDDDPEFDDMDEEDPDDDLDI